jgi:hypothetical protein
LFNIPLRSGHDNGLIVFKLERERPAFALSNNTLFYIRDKTIRMRDLTSGSDIGVMSVKKLGSQYVQPRAMSYNPAERAVIVTSVSYELSAVEPHFTTEAERKIPFSYSNRPKTACTSSSRFQRTDLPPKVEIHLLKGNVVQVSVRSS